MVDPLLDGIGLGKKTGRFGKLDDLEDRAERRDGQGEGNQPSERTDGSHRTFSSLGFHLFRFLFVLLRDYCSYSFLLFDDPQDTTAMAPGIESVLIDFVGQISRLDGAVCGPFIYASSSSCFARFSDLGLGSISIAQIFH